MPPAAITGWRYVADDNTISQRERHWHERHWLDMERTLHPPNKQWRHTWTSSITPPPRLTTTTVYWAYRITDETTNDRSTLRVHIEQIMMTCCGHQTRVENPDWLSALEWLWHYIISIKYDSLTLVILVANNYCGYTCSKKCVNIHCYYVKLSL